MAISKIIGSGLGTINSPVEFTSADNLAQITLTSTDADATVGPTLKMYRASGSGADNDAIGELNFNFNNDAQEETIGTRMRNFIIDASNGTEDAAFDIFSMKAGALTSIINYDSSTLSFNDGSADIDFRVETNGVADAFFVNGGDNQIEIGVPILMDNSDTGTTRIYEWNETAWTLKKQINGLTTGERSGFSVSINGNGVCIYFLLFLIILFETFSMISQYSI